MQKLYEIQTSVSIIMFYKTVMFMHLLSMATSAPQKQSSMVSKEAYMNLSYCSILMLSVPQISDSVIPDTTITVACFFFISFLLLVHTNHTSEKENGRIRLRMSYF